MNQSKCDRRGFLKKLALIVLVSGNGTKALAGMVRTPQPSSTSDKCKDCPFRKPARCSSKPDTCGCPHTRSCRLKLDARACQQCPVRAGLIDR